MKIIKEIEKSRLKDENMNQIIGGNDCSHYFDCPTDYSTGQCYNVFNSCSDVTICGISDYRTCENQYLWVWG